MLIGPLNQWIRIEKAIRAKGKIGTPTDSYSLLFETWAGVGYAGGSERSDDKGSNVRIDAIITIRYEPEVDYKCRIFHSNQYYTIDAIETIGRDEGLRLKCIQWVDG